jgi:broad specificity phosphatase PhoE
MLLARIVDLGFMFDGGGLTPLGREVAERLRPSSWRADQIGASIALIRPDGSVLELAISPRDRTYQTARRLFEEAERIADLLTKADAEEAKRYRTG